MTAASRTDSPARLVDVPDRDRLTRLTAGECTELAARIRHYLVAEVTRTGGHLGANLGTVELTIALHRHFRSPETPIIWDTGHQSYTHKILTGRLGGFAGLRARTGLSGFPSRGESSHDLLENSHAGVGPAWAYGVAVALRRPAVVVIGDGALTTGVAYEALTAIGYRRVPVVLVVNDNGRSYAGTPSRLSYGEPLTGSGRPAAPADFFTSLGLAYHGPVDGHDIAELDAAFARAARGGLPCVVHVRTQKGQGWPPALADDRKRLHDVGPADPATEPGNPAGPGWSQLLGEFLCELAATDPRLHVLTAAMPDTLGLERFRTAFPERYHDLGIAEQACVAVAAGLASQGRRPVFPVVTTFLTRALDQVLNDVALHRLPVIFALDRAGITGPDGPSHHGAYDVGLLRSVPGMEIHAPATADDLRHVLRDALGRDHGPLAIRYAKGTPAPAPAGPAVREGLVRPGRDVLLVAHGPMLPVAMAAARRAQDRDGVDCGVWKVSRLHPLDPALVRHAAGLTRVMPVEDVSEYSGLGPVLAAALAALPGAGPRIESLTLPARFLPHGGRDELLAEFGLTAGSVADAVAGRRRQGALTD